MRLVKLGYMIGYWGAGPPAGVPEGLAAAERLGFDSCWTAEAYGSDALTPLAWWGAATERIKLGTSICQISARTPTAMAMAALTLDHLSGGRFVLGLGASGPQVVEGWYGDDYRKPLARTREYVEIIRQVLAREAPVEFKGERYQLPNPHGTGFGKPLKSITHPLRADLPIYLAAEGPKNVALAAEIADGWLPMFYAPRVDGFYRDALAEGFARPDARRTADEFEVACHVPIIIADDVEAAADFYRPVLALYIGGMGAREVNFHNEVFVRMGYMDEARHIQDLYLDGKKEEAAAAVPLELVEDVALDRSEGEDPRRPRAVAGVDGHHDDRVGPARAARDDRRAGARLTGAPSARSHDDHHAHRRGGPRARVPDGEVGHDARQLSAVVERGGHRVQPVDEPRSDRHYGETDGRAGARLVAGEGADRAGSRRPGSASIKHRHVVDEALRPRPCPESTLLGVLLLRGAQTPG